MLTMLLLIAIALLLAAVPWLAGKLTHSEDFANTVTITAINTTPKGRGTRLADASFTARYLIAKQGADVTHIDICGLTDKPFAVVPDMTPTADAAASDLSYPLPVNILGLNEDTERMIASGVVAIDDLVVPAAAGLVKTLPTTAGSYWVVGKAVTASLATGDMIEVTPCFPYQVSVAPPASVEVVTATNVITASESGKHFFLSSATEFVSTLPAPAAGLEFWFHVDLAPSSASYTIVTASGTDLIHGSAVSAADAGGSVDSTAGTAADTITFVDGQALKGDFVHVISDGTSWYADGVCSDEDAITFTQS